MHTTEPYSKLALIYDRLMDHVDYRQWSEQEGVLRKVGIIRRFNRASKPIPQSLEYICLYQADL